jgi:hypothetical protein
MNPPIIDIQCIAKISFPFAFKGGDNNCKAKIEIIEPIQKLKIIVSQVIWLNLSK